MTNRFLWFTILIVGIFYFSMPKAKKSNNTFISVFKFNDKIESKLALIPTSPRWKYPNQNHNASLDVDGDYVFPPSTLPIVSIKVKEESFFSYKKGIYIRGLEEWNAQSMDLPWWEWPSNYRKRGKKWERKAKISFYGFDEIIPDHNIGIRINGNATRAFPQKTLRIVFKADECENVFFRNLSILSFKTLLLNNSGNDWDRAFLRDILTNSLSSGVKIEVQDSKASNVYINGEYWGIHFIRPKIDDDYLSKLYNINAKDISIIESPLVIYRGKKKGLEEFIDLLDFVENSDLTIMKDYNLVKSKLDITSFIDYLIIEFFIVNSDWPQNNWKIWKDLSDNYNNGKWKWILNDTDYGLGFFSDESYFIDMELKLLNNGSAVGILFTSLNKNKEFQELFKQRSSEILLNEWSEESFNKKIKEYEDLLNPEMPHQINRWRTHLSVQDWESEVNDLRHFYTNRIKQLE